MPERHSNVMRNFDGSSIKRVKEENLHITLKFLGDVPDERIRKIIDKLKGVKFDCFSVNLRRIGVFPHPNYLKIIWIGIDPMDQLKELVDKINGALGAPSEDYIPHVTVVRVNRKPDANIIKWLKENENVEIGEQKVDKFALKKSVLTPDGPEYEDVGVFMAKS
jgi:2'-5' RNA ligase